MPNDPTVSFIMATHNRRDVLLNTLGHVDRCGLPSAAFEILVVDNASDDDTVAVLRDTRPDVRVIALRRNLGSCAKDVAIDHARGEYVVFLDDDSYPLGDSLANMISHFEDDPTLGAAGFRVFLPDGREEGAALPGIFIGCGVGFRRHALRMVGGLDRSYFMEAEEYELSFRLAAAGFRVLIFDDLAVRHHKTGASRNAARIAYLDLRNNLMLAATYIPRPWHRAIMQDWTLRYSWLVMNHATESLSRDGTYWGWIRGTVRRWSRHRSRLSSPVFRQLFGFDAIASLMATLQRQGHRRVLFADFGKNIYPYFDGARRARLEIVSILDDRFARAGRHYRGIPIEAVEVGLRRAADAVVISNSAPVHARATIDRLHGLTGLPIVQWTPVTPPRRLHTATRAALSAHTSN